MNIKTCIVTLGLLVFVVAGCGGSGGSSDSAELEAALAKAEADKAIAEAQAAQAKAELLQAQQSMPETGVVSADAKPESTVNTQLFESAIRAAMDFKPSESDSKAIVPLANELRLIKPAVKSKADQDVFEALEDLALVQKEVQVLSVAMGSMKTGFQQLLAVLQVQLDEMKQIINRTPAIKNTPAGKQAVDNLTAVYEFAVRAVEITSEGGVVTSLPDDLPNDAAQPFNEDIKKSGITELANKYNVPITTVEGISFFPAETLSKLLKLAAEKFTDEANSMRFK